MNPTVIAPLFADWPAPTQVCALQTRRSGGVSRGVYASLNLGDHVGDDAEAVRENRHRLRTALALPGAPHWLTQVHGTHIVRAPQAAPGARADALWSSQPGVVCAIMTADCLPILLCSDDGAVVAAIHAGWRGLADGVIESALAALPLPPVRFMAWLGAAISANAFEVGGEVRARLLQADPQAQACFVPGRADRWQADLYALARRRLSAQGLTRVYGGNACTFSDPLSWFSHRRDGVSGRMVSLIWIRPDVA
ncbi:peptidoglycan editing factor PgeF [Sinimarinibacterium sp. NLF-5-8]|uniref:peptidoglycan editing factor PgeF n=1 Tax=Sinimarinibacterium sp. NLF-5-8 TaxID=2698684 RepID=UPI001EE4E6E6|nr:peptidoglycan editing factor PgeF [Sinimarinibacterium sp. NLF-5-8]